MSVTVPIIELAEAVKSQLEAATLSQTFVAERDFISTFKPETDQGIHISISGLIQSFDLANGTRSASQDDYSITLVINKNIVATQNPAKKAELDGLLAFSQEVMMTLFTNKQLADFPNATLNAMRNSPVYEPALVDQGLFQSIWVFDYRMIG